MVLNHAIIHLGINLLVLADSPGKHRWLGKKITYQKRRKIKTFSSNERRKYIATENDNTAREDCLLQVTADEQKHHPVVMQN